MLPPQPPQLLPLSPCNSHEKNASRINLTPTTTPTFPSTHLIFISLRRDCKSSCLVGSSTKRCRTRTCCYSVPSMRTDVAELFYDVLRSTHDFEPHLISAPSSRTSAMRWDGMGDDCHKVGYIVHKVTDFRAQQHEIPKLLL